MTKIGVVIVDGVGYRNFILSDFFKELILAELGVVIFSGLKRDVYDLPEFSSCNIYELETYNESSISWTFRKAKELAHLYRNKNSLSIRNNLKNRYPKNKGKKAILTKIILKFTSVFNSEKWIDIYYKLQYHSFKTDSIVKNYFEVLKESKCDILFFTHQRPAYLAALDYSAKKLNIKTCSFIFSWDNITSKGRMAAPFDSFLVWSELMKSELYKFYPCTINKKVKVIGTPQFEPYVLDRYHKDENYFHSTFDLDESKKTIYYSCGDVSTSKLDPLYIETIAQLIINNKIVEPVNFIVRTSPAEDGKRFFEIKEQYPFIKWNFPKWNLTRDNHTEMWSQRVPEFDDLCDLRALLMYADVNINMCSTMSLDFMIFNKPVINAVFGNEENGLYNDQKYLNYSHYKKVVESGAVAVALNKAELLEAINDSLTNPLKLEKYRQEILKLEISKPLKGTSKRIVEALIELSE